MTFMIPSKNTYIDNRTYAAVSIIHALAISTKVYEEDSNLGRVKSKIDKIFISGNMPYCLTQEFMEKIESDRKYIIEEISYKVLSDTVTEYEKNLSKLLGQETFSEAKFKSPINNGLISSFPMYVKQAREREEYSNIISRISSISEYIGELKVRKTIKVKIISKRFVKTKDFWVINAIEDDKNLLLYFTNDSTGIHVGKSYKIRATPVKHDFSDFNRCKETRVSRVVIETAY